jgi:hypothetical protein
MPCPLRDARLATLLLQCCCLGLLMALLVPEGQLTTALGSPWLWAVAAPLSAMAAHALLWWRLQRLP